jgi:hypothetical protein
MVTEQRPLISGFGPRTTAEEALAGHDLPGKVAIVTGGHAGLGLETTRVLSNAAAGRKPCYLWDRTLVLAPAKIAKNRSEQVPPRHRVGAYLACSSSRRSIASSKNRIKKGLWVSYPHSLNVRSELVGFHLLTQKRARRA